MTDRRVVLLIPARGGSTRLPRKNLCTVGGSTLVARAIEVCRSVYDEPVVITEDDEIAREAYRLGVAVLRNHPGDGPSARVAEQAAYALGLSFEDAVVLVQPTSPLRDPRGVERVARAMASGCPKVVTVYPDTGKRTGSAYGATLSEWSEGNSLAPDTFWARAMLIPSADGPDVNTQADLDECERIYAARAAKAG